MRQQTLADNGFEKFRKRTRKEQFLDEMEVIILWKDLTAAIEPFYPQAEGAGWPPIGIERMLRIHFLQHWFNLSDPAVEEALYDSRALRQFVGIDLGREPAPDETTVCKFRHLLEQHNLGDQLFHLVNQFLQENGLKVSRGTIVDASIIHAPSSTKNQKKQRDPEMRQTRKGNQWYFGMKAHIGVDSKTRVWGDSAYTGQKHVMAEKAPAAQDFTQAKGSRGHPLTEEDRSRNRNKSQVRARVEHQFAVIKRQFGFNKVRYRGLDKNAHRLYVACALSNLVLAKKTLLKRRRWELQASCA